MAAITLTAIEPESLDQAETFEVAFVTGHSVGDIVTPAGVITTGVTDVIGGVVIRAGTAGTNGNKTLVMRRGVVRGVAGAGAVADAIIYSDGDNTASDTEPSATGRITELGYCISATRALLDVTMYDSGGA